MLDNRNFLYTLVATKLGPWGAQAPCRLTVTRCAADVIWKPNAPHSISLVFNWKPHHCLQKADGVRAYLCIYRVTEHFMDLVFVAIKLGSSVHSPVKQGGYHHPTENFTNVWTKDSQQGAGTPCIFVCAIRRCTEESYSCWGYRVQCNTRIHVHGIVNPVLWLSYAFFWSLLSRTMLNGLPS